MFFMISGTSSSVGWAQSIHLVKWCLKVSLFCERAQILKQKAWVNREMIITVMMLIISDWDLRFCQSSKESLAMLDWVWKQLPVWVQETDTLSTLKISFKLSFLIKLIVRAGSGDPEPSLSYAAIGSGCWWTSHDALLSSPLPSFHSWCFYMSLLHVLNFCLLSP